MKTKHYLFATLPAAILTGCSDRGRNGTHGSSVDNMFSEVVTSENEDYIVFSLPFNLTFPTSPGGNGRPPIKYSQWQLPDQSSAVAQLALSSCPTSRSQLPNCTLPSCLTTDGQLGNYQQTLVPVLDTGPQKNRLYQSDIYTVTSYARGCVKTHYPVIPGLTRDRILH